MQLRIALSCSLLVHAGFLVGLWCYSLNHGPLDVAYTVVRGEPLVAEFSAPSPVAVAASEPIPDHSMEDVVTDSLLPEGAVDRQSVDNRPPPETELPEPPEGAPEKAVLLARKRLLEEPFQTRAAPLPLSPPRRMPMKADVVRHELISLPSPPPVMAGADVDQPPRKLPLNPAPRYPREALVAGIEGRVLIRVAVRADGTVDTAHITTSSGSAILDEAALEAVLTWRFDPARRGGQAVAYDVLVPVRFSIIRG